MQRHPCPLDGFRFAPLEARKPTPYEWQISDVRSSSTKS